MHRPKKRFGQNFLRDGRVLTRILAAVAPRPDDHIVEIGPGKGALTRYLLPHCRRLDAIEIDRDLIERLEEKFEDQHFHVHAADALAFDFRQLAAPGKRLKVVGNLPYNISTPLLFHLFEQKAAITEMVFMLQKEVVERLAALPGNKQYGRLSVMAQYHCRMEKLFTVGPESFQPSPKVTSAVIRLTPHEVPPVEVGDLSCFKQVVTAAFGQRRKTLRNSLKSLLPVETIDACGIDPRARAETLSLEDFGRLSQAMEKAPVHPIAG